MRQNKILTHQLPHDFCNLVIQQFGKSGNDLILSLESEEHPVSIRYNLFKSKINLLDNAVPWCRHAQYLFQRPKFTLDPSFHAGAYYVQEASSMILHFVLNAINCNKSSKVLDLCAAPGGKTTLLADYFDETAIIVANEVIKSRVSLLEENIIKWGRNNIVITQNDPRDFHKLESFFDIILIDAPCSGEGMFRKDKEARKEWSLEHVSHCAIRQQRIVEDVNPALKENGFIIYSTCTFNNSENIDNVGFILNQGYECIPIDFPEEWGIFNVVKEDSLGYQLLPNKLKGEGFFFSVMKKISSDSGNVQKSKRASKLSKTGKLENEILQNWIDDTSKTLIHENGDVYAFNDGLMECIDQLLSNLQVRYSGVKCGNLKSKLFIPHHALALSDIKKETLQFVDLNKNDALKYLNKTMTNVETNNGWQIVTYQGLGLGWLKNLGNRINNYLPNEYRIRMDIE